MLHAKWSLEANGLRTGKYMHGYADNLPLMTTGKFPSTVAELMQRDAYSETSMHSSHMHCFPTSTVNFFWSL
jgi:hypothetical protein